MSSSDRLSAKAGQLQEAVLQKLGARLEKQKTPVAATFQIFHQLVLR